MRSEDLGLKLEDCATDASLLGSCSNITISKDDTLILNGTGEKTDIEARCTGIRDQIAATKSEYEKEKLQVRPRARLSPHRELRAVSVGYSSSRSLTPCAACHA